MNIVWTSCLLAMICLGQANPVIAQPPTVATPPAIPASSPTTCALSGVIYLQSCESLVLQLLREHEAAEAKERAEAETFRQTVGGEYKKAVTFIVKYILPAVGAALIGREMGK